MEEELIKNQERLKPQEEKQEEERSRVDDLRGSPMSVGTLEEIIDDNHAIVSTSVGSEHYVSILSFVDKDQLEPGGFSSRWWKLCVCRADVSCDLISLHCFFFGCFRDVRVYECNSLSQYTTLSYSPPGCSVLLNHKVHAVIGVLGDDTDPMVSVMKLEKAPQESYADVGGLDAQIQEIKESVELPLTHPELYEEMGIKPPKGVILYGAPGTGKTLLAKVCCRN